MKRTLIFAVMLVLGAGGAQAQELKAATQAEKSAQKSVRVRRDKPNEVTVRKVSYSGALPQLGKTGNPLQLVDPRAPQEAGKAEDNTAVDPIEKKPRGIIVLRLRW